MSKVTDEQESISSRDSYNEDTKYNTTRKDKLYIFHFPLGLNYFWLISYK